jgi:hypothetical protein
MALIGFNSAIFAFKGANIITTSLNNYIKLGVVTIAAFANLELHTLRTM